MSINNGSLASFTSYQPGNSAAMQVTKQRFNLICCFFMFPATCTLQVEYQFSDINLVANEFLLKIMNKDTEGYGKSYVVSHIRDCTYVSPIDPILLEADQ